MSRTKVVHVRKAKFDVYCGRAFAEFPQSPYHNPFRVGPDGTREECVLKFRRYFLANPALVAKAKRELQGKTLGCWCAPALCHLHVIAEIIDQDELIPADSPRESQASLF
jgi:hypothetical protein